MLYFDPDPSALLMHSADGVVVWPAPSPDLEALQQTASLFATRTIPTNGIPVRDINQQGAEEVVAFGDGFCIPEAKLYAHLTHRKFRMVSCFQELIETRRPEVLVTQSRHVTHRLLDFLYDPESDEPSPGILFSNEESSLRRQVLVRAAASQLDGAISHRRVSFIATADLNTETLLDHYVVGGRASDAEIVGALSQGAGVLSVSTHSDGIDAFITKKLTLCPFDKAPRGVDFNRSPVCYETGFCHRSNVSVPQAIQDNRLLGVNAIAARILIWNVCNGIIAESGKLGKVIDGNWGLIPQMLKSPKIGCILTTWYQTLSAPLQIDTLAADIASGVEVGAALSEFHRSPQARMSGIRYCLIGDPRMALPSPASTNVSQDRKKYGLPIPIPFQSATQNQPKADARLVDAEFLRIWLSRVSSKQRLQSARESADQAIKAVTDYIEAVRLYPEVEASIYSSGTNMRERVISHLARFGSLASRTWLQEARNPTLQRPAPKCFGCGLQTNTYEAYAKTDTFRPRRVSICPGCGIIEDVPLSSEALMSLEDGMRVSLQGINAQGAWDCKVVAESMGPRNHMSWRWPSQERGAPVQSFTLPGPFPPGPVRIVILFMLEAKLFILQQPGRAPEDQWLSLNLNKDGLL